MSFVGAGISPAENSGVIGPRLPQENDTIATRGRYPLKRQRGANYTRAVVVSEATLKFWPMDWTQTLRMIYALRLCYRECGFCRA